MKYYIIFSAMSILFYTSCRKECQFGGAYEFEIPVTLSPAKDTFQIGDTITITSSFSDEVYEKRTENWYELKDFNFSPQTTILNIDSSSINGEILGFFDILIDKKTTNSLQPSKCCI